MDSKFEKSIFSSQFNLLKVWGAWPRETDNPVKKKFYTIYSITAMLMVIFVSFTGVLDFLQVLKDFRKLPWNLCVNVIIIGMLGKNIRSFIDSDDINLLRKKLHRDVDMCEDYTDVEIYEKYITKYKKLIKCFHYPLSVCYPIFAGESIYRFIKYGDLPLPQKWPWEYDKYNLALGSPIVFLHLFTAGILLLNAMTTDLSMFGLLFQISMEYEYLIKDIEELKNFWQDEHVPGTGTSPNEINTGLKNKVTKIKLGLIISRQKELAGYASEFERNYNVLMLAQLFLGGLLIVVNAIQTMTLSLEFQLKTTPQGAYVTCILLDILILCSLGNNITDLSHRVGDAMYDLPWYIMDVELRKDILFIILCSQRPPRLSAGKFLDLNMETFSEAIKNMYRWLAVFRQIGFL